MATFASAGMAQQIADGEEEKDDDVANGEQKPSESVDPPKAKQEPKRLGAHETQSIFALKNEFLKKRNAMHKTRLPDEYVAGKSGVLSVKKDEKERMDTEAAARSSRISENEAAWKREEAERFEMQQRKMKEKAELYDRLQSGHIVLQKSDDTPVDFMVDFGAKKRQKESERDGADEEPTVRRGREPSIERYHHSEEQRVFGVSHMRLSANEDKRRAEIEELKETSRKNLEERNKRRLEQSAEDAVRKAKAAKLRKLFGLPAEEVVDAPEVTLEEIPMPAVHETPEQRHERLIKSDREWDRGKGRYNTWIEKERDERDDEFAPPSSYNSKSSR